MKNSYKFTILLLVAYLFLSNSSSHPVGRSGAPGDGLCSNCHGGTSSFQGNVSLSGVPSVVEPGVVYSITVELEATSGTPLRGGFQVVALRDANDTQAGTWGNTDSFSSLKSSGGRVYFGHQPFRTFGGGSDVTWEAEWEAPNITDDITFYMAGNLANGNGSTSGDEIVTEQLTVEVTATELLELNFDDIISTSCFDGGDGSARAVVTGGVPPYSYSWDNGENTAVASNLDAGFHFLTVTDDNGDEVDESVLIPEPPEIEADITLIDISCFGEDDGEIIVDAFGGTGDLECQWETLGEGCIQDGLEQGLYLVSIIDENNCHIDVEIELLEPQELVLNTNTTDASASNNDGTASCIPSGGTEPYLFEWSNGASETGQMSTITDLSRGEYSVTVTDENGCVETETVDVEGVICAIVVDISITEPNCYGDSTGIATANVSNALQPIQYLWSNNSTASTINGQAGNYTLTVTDSNNCTATSTAIIGQPDSLQLDSLQVVDNSCANDLNGAISFQVSGGSPGYSLVWSNGIINDTAIMNMDTIITIPDSISMLESGMYGLSITDNKGCILIDSFLIQTLDTVPPFVNVSDFDWFITETGTTPLLDESLLAGTYSDNCQLGRVEFDPVVFNCTQQGFQDLEITVFDTNENSSVEQFQVNVRDITPPDLNCNNSDMEINSCEPIDYLDPIASDNCAVIDLVQSEGIPSGSLYPNGITINTFIASDAAGNTSTCSFSITVNSELIVDINVNDASCKGNDGSIELNISGGNPPYHIEPGLDSLTPGTYTVSVMDAASCFYEQDVEVFQDDISFNYEIMTENVACFGNSDGSADVIITEMSDSARINVLYEQEVDPEMLTQGDYTITIEDESMGCKVVDDFTIEQPDSLVIDVIDVILDPCSYIPISWEEQVSGGTGPYNISQMNTSSGTIFNVEDALGCTASFLSETEIPSDFLAIDSIDVTDVSNESNGSIEIFATGGKPPYSYLWTDSSGATISMDSIVTGLQPGSYSLVLSDSFGCELSPVTIDVDMVSVTNHEELNSGIQLRPNPIIESLQIEFSDRLPEVITLYNLRGERIFTDSPKGRIFYRNLSQLQSGVYVLRMDYPEIAVVKRLIKL